MQTLTLDERFGWQKTRKGFVRAYKGEIEFEIRDATRGIILNRYREPNLIKIFAKEILAHRLPYGKVWDPTASSGAGDWVSSGIDPDEELAAKYITFGASFDDSGNPLDTADTRFYSFDAASGGFVPISLGVGAEYSGGLINPVPIAEPLRPLKRIERVYFEPSYQPAGTPLLQDDVRAMNNVVVMETTLRKDEYNGFGVTSSDFYTITEVALVAGRELAAVGACECDPQELFLEGSGTDAILATASGTATVTIDPSEASFLDVIKEGDQVKIVEPGATAASTEILNQVSPYYLVITKALGGSDVTLDRVPVDSNNVPLTGQVGLFKDGFRIFSHRILNSPLKKSLDFEIVVRWRIIMA